MPVLQSVRRVIRSSRITAIVLPLCVGCGELVAAPPRGPVSGRWVGNFGTDAWSELRLDERGGRITGVYGFGSANFGGQFSPSAHVLGYASGAVVIIDWNAYGYQYRVHATLSADGRTLSGTMSVNGGPRLPFGPFGRAAAGLP